MKYDITFSCGHKGTLDLIGKQEERDRAIYRAEHYCTCPECQARKREEENKKNAELAKNMSLPDLEGSEKEVAFANTIRTRFIQKNPALKEKVQKSLEEKGKDWIIEKCMSAETYQQRVGARNIMLMLNSLTNNSAKWFIENRFEF